MNYNKTKKIKQLKSFAKQKQWQAVIEHLPTEINLTDDIQLIKLAGMAYAYQYDALLAEKSVKYLSFVWNKSEQQADVFWALMESMHTIGKREQSIPIIKTYLKNIKNPNEYVDANAWLAMIYEILSKDALAIKTHQDALMGLGAKADDVTKANSYINSHVRCAYQKTGRTQEWVTPVMSLWHCLADKNKPFQKRFMLLYGIALNIKDYASRVDSDVQAVIDFFNTEVRIVENTTNMDDPEQISNLASIYTTQYVFYINLSNLTEANNAFLQASNFANRLYQKTAEAINKQDASFKHFAPFAYRSLHNLSSVAKDYKHPQTISLLKKAVEIAIELNKQGKGYPVGITYYNLSACLLSLENDKEQSLHYLRKIAEDSYWGYGGLCLNAEKMFKTDEAFKHVQDDKDYLAVFRMLSNRI